MESTVHTDTYLLNEDVVVEASFNDSITLSTNTERIDVISKKNTQTQYRNAQDEFKLASHIASKPV